MITSKDICKLHNWIMNCPHCGYQFTSKNGRRGGRQNYICKGCGRQFLEFYCLRGYSDDVRKICIRMHQNGMKYREIERMTGISHNTIILWIRQIQVSKESHDQEYE